MGALCCQSDSDGMLKHKRLPTSLLSACHSAFAGQLLGCVLVKSLLQLNRPSVSYPRRGAEL
jgi:hypothetical protein